MAKAYTPRLSGESFKEIESNLDGLGEAAVKKEPDGEAFLCSERKDRSFSMESFDRLSASLMFPDSVPYTDVTYPNLDVDKALRMFGEVRSLVTGWSGVYASLTYYVVSNRNQKSFSGICERAPIELVGPLPRLRFELKDNSDGARVGVFKAKTGESFEEGWVLEFIEGCRMAFERLAEEASGCLSRPVERLGGKAGSFAMDFSMESMEDPRLIERCFNEFVPVLGKFSEAVAAFEISIPKVECNSGSLDELKSKLLRILGSEHRNDGFWTMMDVWMQSDDVIRRRDLIAGTIFENEEMAFTVWKGKVKGKRTEVFRDYGRKGGRLGIRVWASGPEFEEVKAYAEGVLGVKFENNR
jgi:hypothetical protein